MNEIREIVTKAVVAKGRKTIRLKDIVSPGNETFSILGCWVINHEFNADLDDNIVCIDGSLEVNIWYACDDNSRTEIARKVIEYNDSIKTRQIVKDVTGSKDDIARVTQQPSCTNASIVDDGIEVEIVLEIVAEVIGETKILVTTLTNIDTISDDDFENEINENFINENNVLN